MYLLLRLCFIVGSAAMADSPAKVSAEPSSPLGRTEPSKATADDDASPGKVRNRVAKAPKVTAGLQEMLDRASDQRQTEVLATRLAVLKQQEQRVSGQIEQTKARTQHMITRKEEQGQRIREKAEALRKMHLEAGFYVEHDRSKAQTMPFIAESEPLALEPRSHQSLVGSQVIGSQVQAATPRPGLSSHSVRSTHSPRLSQAAPSQLAASQTPRQGSFADGPRSGQSSHAASKVTTPRVLSSRIQTSDIVQLVHAQAVLRVNHATNQREPAVLGAYAGEGERIWMPPREGVDAAVPKDATIPARIAKMNPKQLVAKMEKKEAELKARLDSARKAQLVADDALQARFKTYSAMQVSARKAIREGSY